MRELLWISPTEALAVVLATIGMYLAMLIFVRVLGPRVLSGMCTNGVCAVICSGTRPSSSLVFGSSATGVASTRLGPTARSESTTMLWKINRVTTSRISERRPSGMRRPPRSQTAPGRPAGAPPGSRPPAAAWSPAARRATRAGWSHSESKLLASAA